LAKNIVFNLLSKFSHFFVSLNVDFQLGKEILLFFTLKYELEVNRAHLLLSELQSA
jgi:hypothetical protein